MMACLRKSLRQQLQPEVLSSLIGEIYDCALNPTHWNGVLTRIADYANAEYATIILAETGAPMPVMAAHSERDQKKLKALTDKFGFDMPGINELSSGKLDVPVSALNLMNEEEFQKGRFYREWLAPQGLRDGCVIKFAQTEKRLGLATFVTRSDRDLINEDERWFMRILSPHLRYAARIGNLLDQNAVSLNIYKHTLDCVPSPVFITDGEGRVQHANTAAKRVLSAGRGVAMVGERLTAISPTLKSGLADAISRSSVVNGVQVGHRGVALPMSVPGQPPIAAYIMPLACSKVGGSFSPATVAVLLSLADFQVLPSESMLTALFDLTPAEARVMMHAGRGRQLSDISGEICIGENTVKTHLSRVYSKTATARQAELVALMAGFACR
jgi:DNA-binding CsgD family transcriptional regulator